MVILLDSDELAIRFNNENMTMQEFYNQSEIIGYKKHSTQYKRLPEKNLAKLTTVLDRIISKVNFKIIYFKVKI